MSVGDVAGLIAAVAFVALVALLALPIVKLGRLIDDARGTVQGVTNESLPLLREVTATVTTTNGELERVSAITTNVQQMTTNASALTALFAATVGSPVIKVAAFTYGVRQALSGGSSRRRGRRG